MKFQTKEWASEFMRCLNNNPNYEKSAKTWEGALALEFKADGSTQPADIRLWLDLWHGKCRDAAFLGETETRLVEYTISAPETTWRALLSGEIDPTRAMVSGKFKISGNTSKLMRYPLAAGYIIKYLKRLLTEW